MPNKKLFKSKSSKIPVADTVNEAGGKAYSRTAEQALANMACTGCLGDTFYSDASKQLDEVKSYITQCDPEFVLKTAIYARQTGYMKDMPAIMVAAVICSGYHQKGPTEALQTKYAFNKVMDNMKMIRNFVQVMRSGTLGRSSLGSFSKKLVQQKISLMSDNQLFTSDVGQDPSLKDIIKMVHPSPKDTTDRNAWNAREALYSYLIDKDVDFDRLPDCVKNYENFKNGKSTVVPNVPFQKLTNLNLSTEQWSEIFMNAGWHMTRMNINTALRHDVLKDTKMVDVIANRLKDKTAIQKAKVFPYQLLSAYMNIESDTPRKIINALHDATEISVDNVPEFPGNVYIGVDTSGSMSSPITGGRGTATSKMRCVDIAAMFASTILRKNDSAVVLPFDTRLHLSEKLEPRDSILTNAKKLAGFGGGGTNCSLPLDHIKDKKVDLYICISDNESWADYMSNRVYRNYGSNIAGTASQECWKQIKKNNKNAKMVLIDIQPYSSAQMKSSKDVLFVSGFSDNVFNVIDAFMKQNSDPDFWVNTLKQVPLQ